MNTRVLARAGLLPSLLALSLATGCGLEPTAAPRDLALNESTAGELSETPEVGAQVLGALEMLYGTAAEPGYMLTADWYDDGYDPNYPTYEEGDAGSGSVSEAQLDAIHADNETRFARQLAAIDEGRYEDVEVLWKPGLAAAWADLLTDRDEIEEFGEEARLTFAEYYPTLSESAELYRIQCLHCHGNAGGGDGPTAEFLDPLPRDYRKGIFKFTAVKDKARPSRADLFRILADGVPGTAMPSFRRFSDAELHGLVDYVMLLAKRGETEALLVASFTADDVLTAEMVTETYAEVEDKWRAAPEWFFAYDGEVPEPTEELLARGREVFNDATTGNCASCHGMLGRGDGESAFKPDPTDPTRTVSAYDDDWGNPILPRDLTVGIFRGGRRPIDIYRRIYAGINGTPMPALGESRGADGSLLVPPDDMWALVHYVRSLSEREDGEGLKAYSKLASGQAGASDHSHAHEDSGADTH